MNKLTIAIDFDGTCVKHAYPNIGEDIGAVPVLKKLVDNGHKLILNTMRGATTEHGNTLAPAVNWFKENGIELSGINFNKEQITWTSSPKVYANLYIDDAALGCPLTQDEIGNTFADWNAIEKILNVNKII